jgi:hypothetical protein
MSKPITVKDIELAAPDLVKHWRAVIQKSLSNACIEVLYDIDGDEFTIEQMEEAKVQFDMGQFFDDVQEKRHQLKDAHFISVDDMKKYLGTFNKSVSKPQYIKANIDGTVFSLRDLKTSVGKVRVQALIDHPEYNCVLRSDGILSIGCHDFSLKYWRKMGRSIINSRSYGIHIPEKACKCCNREIVNTVRGAREYVQLMVLLDGIEPLLSKLQNHTADIGILPALIAEMVLSVEQMASI